MAPTTSQNSSSVIPRVAGWFTIIGVIIALVGCVLNYGVIPMLGMRDDVHDLKNGMGDMKNVAETVKSQLSVSQQQERTRYKTIEHTLLEHGTRIKGIETSVKVLTQKYDEDTHRR